MPEVKYLVGCVRVSQADRRGILQSAVCCCVCCGDLRGRDKARFEAGCPAPGGREMMARRRVDRSEGRAVLQEEVYTDRTEHKVFGGVD